VEGNWEKKGIVSRMLGGGRAIYQMSTKGERKKDWAFLGDKYCWNLWYPLMKSGVFRSDERREGRLSHSI